MTKLRVDARTPGWHCPACHWRADGTLAEACDLHHDSPAAAEDLWDRAG